MTITTTHRLAVAGAVITYDVHAPDTARSHRPVMVFGSPMGASGFAQLVPHLSDRTVITYDPRMTERRSGGAVAALPWLLAHPDEVGTVVLHEPPLSILLEDADVLDRVGKDIVETYERLGQGPAMAKFIQMVMHDGVFTEEYLDQPAPPPEQFGFSSEDDGSHDDALLGHNMRMTPCHPDREALRASGARMVPAVGAASGAGVPRRGGEALAALLGVEPVEFPGDHGGFVANEWSPDNDPEAFAAKLREVLDGSDRGER